MVAQAIIDRIIGVSVPPELLRSDQGPELKSKMIHKLESILGYKKTRTTSYRPQGNSVSKRVRAFNNACHAQQAQVNRARQLRIAPTVIIIGPQFVIRYYGTGNTFLPDVR